MLCSAELLQLLPTEILTVLGQFVWMGDWVEFLLYCGQLSMRYVYWIAWMVGYETVGGKSEEGDGAIELGERIGAMFMA